MNPLLKAVELPYRGINRMRRSMYRHGILAAKRLGRPVISVGNLAAGGAGKTPAVIAIARHLTSLGLRVVVLTRGYGRSGEGGIVNALDPVRFGDEPVLIKKSVPDATVIVASNRAEYASRSNGDVFILDDGFQHLQLHRDLDVVIDTPGVLFHREGRSALRDADIVIPRRIYPANLHLLQEKRVFAFSGLAANEQFFAMLRTNGIDVTGTRGYADHHRYTARDIAEIRASARGADVIATTEKDAVKLPDADFFAVSIEFLIDPAVMAQIAAVASR